MKLRPEYEKLLNGEAPTVPIKTKFVAREGSE